MFIQSLFPQSKVSWFIWLLLLVIWLPLYYFWKPFPYLYAQYEREKWDNCTAGKELCRRWGQDLEGTKRLFTRIPSAVADFIEVPLEIGVQNVYTTNVSAVVSLVPDTPDGVTIHFTIDGHEQNSKVFESIPPGGEAISTFMVRVSGGKDNEKYPLHFKLDGKDIQPLNYSLKFDRSKVLKLWFTQYLLLPPGSNVVLTVGILLLVSLGEGCYRFTLSCKNRKQDRTKYLLSRTVGMGVLLVFTFCELNARFPREWIVTIAALMGGAVVIGVVCGFWIGDGVEPQKPCVYSGG